MQNICKQRKASWGAKTVAYLGEHKHIERTHTKKNILKYTHFVFFHHRAPLWMYTAN